MLWTSPALNQGMVAALTSPCDSLFSFLASLSISRLAAGLSRSQVVKLCPCVPLPA